MPNFYDGVEAWMSYALDAFGAGHPATPSARGQDESMAALARTLGRWTTPDVQALRGMREPAPINSMRFALGTALRQLMQRGIAGYQNIYAWFDVPPSISDFAALEVTSSYEGHRVWLATEGSITSAQRRTADWRFELSRPQQRYRTPITDPDRLQRYTAIFRGVTSSPPEGLVFEPSTSTRDVVGVVRPTDELLSTLNVRARQFAELTVLADSDNAGRTAFYGQSSDGTFTLYSGSIDDPVRACYPGLTGEALVTRAREAYRAWLRMSRPSRTDAAEAERQRAIEEHRARSRERFIRFRDVQETAPDQVIPTLPFVPHGLASSRRWGIEVESGGARGVDAPPHWNRTGDGSLRSAWDGYREVQNFEPYEEEQTANIPWFDCPQSQRHMPGEEYYDADLDTYAFRIRDDYLAPADCDQCGNRTRMVLVTPQTTVHTAQNGDCAEFVSPILVSMHSNGLEQLLSELVVQPQNDSAGIHVHVEARDLSDKQIATLVYGYDLLEPIIESSYRRTRRNYCERRSAENVIEMARLAKGHHSFDVRGGSRYVTVNTHALNRHGTIEFRAMGPVYEYEHLIRWAMFCREMVNVVAAGATQKDFGRIKKWEDVTLLFAKFGKEYLRAMVYEMTGETGSAPRLAKAGRPVTTEALNEDFMRAFTEAVDTSSSAFRRLATSVGDLNRATERLVPAQLTLVSV